MNSSKQKILVAASELFLEGGSTALSVRAIAKHAGISTIGIYSHYQGKQGILDELYIEGFELIYAAMDIDVSAVDQHQEIMGCVERYLDVAEKHEAHYRLIFGESDASYTPSQEALKVAEKAFDRLVNIASLLLPVDSKPQKKQKTAIEMWAFLHGFVSLRHHTISSLMSSEEWTDLTLKAISTHIEGLKARA